MIDVGTNRPNGWGGPIQQMVRPYVPIGAQQPRHIFPLEPHSYQTWRTPNFSTPPFQPTPVSPTGFSPPNGPNPSFCRHRRPPNPNCHNSWAWPKFYQHTPAQNHLQSPGTNFSRQNFSAAGPAPCFICGPPSARCVPRRLLFGPTFSSEIPPWGYPGFFHAPQGPKPLGSQ